MSEWMDILYMENSTLLNNPLKEQGVPVTLTAVDPNSNAITIGITTANSASNYYNFVPSRTGLPTITAFFARSNSYWPSSPETVVTIVNAPTATTSTASTTTSSDVATDTLYIAVIALAIIIIIVDAVLALSALRKRA